MAWSLAALLLLASPLASLASGGSKDAPSSSHARPPECRLLPGEHGENGWERAKLPALRRYCELLASASAKLGPGSPLLAEALRLAKEAETLVPGLATALTLEGRALSRLEKPALALAALRSALARDPRVLDDPLVLLAWARALASTGATRDADAAYRTLLPRVDVLPLADRGAAYLGASVVAMAIDVSGAPLAVAILRQAEHDTTDVLRAAARYMLALALDRSGETSAARAMLAEEGTGDAPSVLSDPSVLAAMGAGQTAKADAVAALALVGEADGKREAARREWRAYLTLVPASDPWRDHAASHLAGRP